METNEKAKKSRRWATFQSAEYPIYCDGHGDCPSYLIYPSDPPSKVFTHWHAPVQEPSTAWPYTTRYPLKGVWVSSKHWSALPIELPSLDICRYFKQIDNMTRRMDL